jgi:mannose PTS system EIIA component
MPSILLVAHAPLAESLLAVARHAYGDCCGQVAAVDVPADASLEQAEARVGAALARIAEPEVLILVDAFGATPCNAVVKVVETAGEHQRWPIVTGVNVPMLWRTLCYGHLPLDELVGRAVTGGRERIMLLDDPRLQNKPEAPTTDDPVANPDQ